MAVEQAIEARALELGLEFGEAALKFPLGGGFLAAAEKLAACGRWIGAAKGLAFTCTSGRAKIIRLFPEVCAGQEVVLHSGARELLDVAVGQEFIVAVQHATASCGGRRLDITGCQLMRLEQGRILEVRGHYSDQEALDAFWDAG